MLTLSHAQTVLVNGKRLCFDEQEDLGTALMFTQLFYLVWTPDASRVAKKVWGLDCVLPGREGVATCVSTTVDHKYI